MDEGLISPDPSDIVWLEALQTYGASDRRDYDSIAQPSTPQEAKVATKIPPSGDDFLSATLARVTSPSLDVHHASPITPLRQRDSEALDDFFESDRIQEIALDIHRYLARMYPEPCWEDEPYEFLRGYI